MAGLTPEQHEQYERDGYVIVESVLSPEYCDDFVAHMMALHAGEVAFDAFKPRNADDWNRTHNQHLYDPRAQELLLHPALRQPLADCFGDEPDAIQTMYFWKGSQQGRHQDAYYLPDCAAAWIALTDVGPDNGTIWVVPGSHKGELITLESLRRADGTLPEGPEIGPAYETAVNALAASYGIDEVPANVRKGGVVFFDGHLIHRGGPIGIPGSFRHVMANHYIPHNSAAWPYKGWLRWTFDGASRDWAPAAG